MLPDYTHTGAPTSPELRVEFWRDYQRDIIDAPSFLPLGYHVSAHDHDSDVSYPIALHMVRPGTFR